MTVIKAAFLGSGRFGSGVVVARLADGTWSPPSAIGTVGAGFGGQVGLELTDFVFILNDASAVRTFAQAGNLTFGGNASVAAGPVGRNAEAAGSATLKGVAAIFAYSKTKGLFAGVSLEGGGMIERREENQRSYGQMVTAEKILSGQVIAPPDRFHTLNQVLQSSVFSSGNYGNGYHHSDSDDDHNGGYRTGPARAQTWQSQTNNGDALSAVHSNSQFRRQSPVDNRRSAYGSELPTSTSTAKKAPPPTRPKPKFTAANHVTGPNQAVAKFTFEAAQPGDLSFKRGDVITIVKRTDKESDWWTGRIGEREGIFPSNYVQT